MMASGLPAPARALPPAPAPWRPRTAWVSWPAVPPAPGWPRMWAWPGRPMAWVWPPSARQPAPWASAGPAAHRQATQAPLRRRPPAGRPRCGSPALPAGEDRHDTGHALILAHRRAGRRRKCFTGADGSRGPFPATAGTPPAERRGPLRRFMRRSLAQATRSVAVTASGAPGSPGSPGSGRPVTSARQQERVRRRPPRPCGMWRARLGCSPAASPGGRCPRAGPHRTTRTRAGDPCGHR
jgi:hypothetical protein